MWMIATYHPVALFSLKVGTATATASKSLLVPTPFAIRTALLDVAIRTEGRTQGPVAFDLLHTIDLALRPPLYAVSSNLFTKALKPSRGDKDRIEAMTRTIAFREYVHQEGELCLAFGGEVRVLEQLARWLPHLPNRASLSPGFAPLARRAARWEPVPHGAG